MQDFYQNRKAYALAFVPVYYNKERTFCEAPTEGADERDPFTAKNLPGHHPFKKYYAAESDQEDLISIGTIGLIKAVNSYRLDKNIRLATYASRCIENAILTPGTFRRPERLS